VHERGDVNQFDDHGQIDMARADRTRGAPGQQCEQRSQPFPAATHRVNHISFDGRIERRRLFRDPFFDRVKMRLHQPGHAGQWTG
jgi:hypothetical protein